MKSYTVADVVSSAQERPAQQYEYGYKSNLYVSTISTIRDISGYEHSWAFGLTLLGRSKQIF